MSEPSFFKVVDDFSSHPDLVRESVLAAGIGTWRPSKGEVGSSVYDGMGFWGYHALMVKPLVKIMGRPIYPNSMFFRVTKEDTEAAYVHSDRESGDFSCIAYLSKHDGETGTAFYRHRESAMERMPSFSELSKTPEFFDKLKGQMVDGSEIDWETIEFVRGGFNRAVIFDAPRFHAREGLIYPMFRDR